MPPSDAAAAPAPVPEPDLAAAQAKAESASSPRKGLGRATALLSAATFLSRVLGLCREQAFAALLGAGYYGDAFTMAFRLPNLLRDLFAEGALSSAFQPVFARRLREGGPEAAYRLANLVQTTLLGLLLLLTVLGIVLAPQMVQAWAAGYGAIPGKAELTVLLTRIMMPFLLLISLAAVAMGMLNAQERFVAPALAPALFNVSAVVVGVGLWLGGIRASEQAAIGWAVATLCGGALQFAVQLPALYRGGYRFRPRLDLRLSDPGLREILLTLAPATIGLMATQVNIYISSSFASAEDGAVTWLNVAFRLLQLPIGMFGVAVGTVALARASREAARALGPGGSAGPGAVAVAGPGAGDGSEMAEALAQVRETLRGGLRMVSFLTLPTLVGLLVLAEPIIAAIYQHGAFLRRDTTQAASALRYYGVGLLAYAAVKVVAPVFYALRLARVPVISTVLAVAANVAFNLALHPRYGFRALALGTSVAALCNLGTLLISFQRRYGGLLRQDLLLALLRMAVAAAVMGVAVSGADGALVAVAPSLEAGAGGALLRLAVGVPLGAVVYGALCRLAGVQEMAQLSERVLRRLRRH
jgi:putative peptidoglycan lipid II flippase